MRLGALDMVNRSVKERDRLLALRAEIEADGLNVVIRGQYQDDAMVALIRPVINGEITGRLRRIESDLVSMGVDLA